MEKRTFGRTGHKVSIITMGGVGLRYVSQEEADRSIASAMENGINIIDVSPRYGDAELKLRPTLQKFRDQFFLAGKTMERTREGAKKELKRSLERLGVETLDLYQVHDVRSIQELKRIMAKDGAIKTYTEARETGLIKYIGLTGHDARIHLKALEMFDFDTLLIPVSAANIAYPNPDNDFQTVLKIALDRTVGIMAMKAISKRKWLTGVQKYNTWYEPTDIKKEIEMMINFCLSQEGVATYSMAGDIRLWPLILEAGKKFRRLSRIEQIEIVEYVKKTGYKPLLLEEYPHVCATNHKK